MMITVCSIKGTVGVSTVALGLAAAAAETGVSWLVEADPSGGVLAGVCPGLAVSPTLESVTLDRVSVTGDVLAGAAQRLGAVQVVLLPSEPWRARVCLADPRSLWFDALGELPGSVVVDVGRIYPGSPAWPLLRMADVVVVVAAPSPMSLASSLEWCEQRGRCAPGVDGLLDDVARVVTVHRERRGRSRSVLYDAAAVGAELGDRLAGQIPWDPKAVDLLCRGASLGHRSLRMGVFARSCRAVVSRLGVGPTSSPADVVAPSEVARVRGD